MFCSIRDQVSISAVRPLAGHRAAILFLQHVATHHSDFFLGLKKKETTYPLRTFFHGTPHILFHLLQGPMNRSRNFCRVFEAKFGFEERSKFMGSFDV